MTLRTMDNALTLNNAIERDFTAINSTKDLETVQNILESGSKRMSEWIIQRYNEIANELDTVGIDKDAFKCGIDLLVEADKLTLDKQAEIMIELFDKTVREAEALYGTHWKQRGFCVRSVLDNFRMFFDSLIEDIRNKKDLNIVWYANRMKLAIDTFINNKVEESIVTAVCMVKAIERDGRAIIEDNWR